MLYSLSRISTRKFIYPSTKCKKRFAKYSHLYIKEHGDRLKYISTHHPRLHQFNLEAKQKFKSLDQDTQLKIMSFIEHNALLLNDSDIQILLDFPWNTLSDDNRNLKTLKQLISSNHFGSHRAIDIFLEYISFYFMYGSFSNNTICLCGPKCSGKSNLVESVAKSLRRKFIRLDISSLINDHNMFNPQIHDSFLDHSFSGIIFKLIHDSGTMNPVILLENIDHMISFSFFKQLLDLINAKSSYENEFKVPIDLSHVLFVCSVENVEEISPMLKENFEIVHINGYSKNEKIKIIRDVLIPKIIEQINLQEYQIRFTDSSIRTLIEKYDPHSDHFFIMSNMIELILKTCVLRLYSDPSLKKIVISKTNLNDYLGNQFEGVEKPKRDIKIGVCLTLNNTIEQIEIVRNQSSLDADSLNIIGTDLSSSTKESIETAFVIAKNIYHEMNIIKPSSWEFHIHIDTEHYDLKNFHENIVGLVLAFLSCYLEMKIPKGFIYSGEASLNGKLLPVKNLEQKIRTAKDEGFHQIFIPTENELDIEQIPEEYKQDLMIYFVSWVQDIVKILFLSENLNLK